MSAILTAGITALMPIIKNLFPNKAEQDVAMLKVLEMDQRGELKVLETQMKAITAEANGESWLQRNWRPLVMLNFVSLVTVHWLGFTPDNITPAEIDKLLDIVKIGLGGYVLGRSGEKMMKAYKQS